VRTDEDTATFKELLKAVDIFCEKNGLPPALSRRVSDYFAFQHRKQAAGAVTIFNQLPLTLKVKVASAQYYRHVQSAWVLRGCNGQFLNQVVIALKQRFVMPLEVLYNKGDGSRELFWCTSGQLAVRKGDVHVATIVPRLFDGQLIGEVVGELAFFLNMQQAYTVFATADGDVTLLVLSGSSYDEIVAMYPEQADAIRANINRQFGLDSRGAILDGQAAGAPSGGEEAEEFEALRLLIKEKIRARTEDALTQMMYAAAQGLTETVRVLASQGLELNEPNYDGRTTLHVASARGHVHVVSLLCDLGAQTHVRDRQGVTPLAEAIVHKHDGVAAVLLARGASLQLEQPSTLLFDSASVGDTQRIASLLGFGVSIDEANHDRRTVLHHAAAIGQVRVVEYLISRLADVNATDRRGWTPLDEAIHTEQRIVSRMLKRAGSQSSEEMLRRETFRAAAEANVDRLRFLADAGALVNARDSTGRTPLHLAVCSGSISTAQFLIYANADVHARDWRGNTPLTDALVNSNETAAILIHYCHLKLPAALHEDAHFESLYAAAIVQDMESTNEKLHFRARLRKRIIDDSSRQQRQLGVAFNALEQVLKQLVHTHDLLYAIFEDNQSHWISTYGELDDDVESDCSQDLDNLDDHSWERGSDNGGDSFTERASGKDPESRRGSTARTDSRRSSAAHPESRRASTASIESRRASTASVGHTAAAAAPASAAEHSSPTTGHAKAKPRLKRIADAKSPFISLMLKLPLAEQGLAQLRLLYTQRLSPTARCSLTEAERRHEEHTALLLLLERDLSIRRADAEAIAAEIYRELIKLVSGKNRAHVRADPSSQPQPRSRSSSAVQQGEEDSSPSAKARRATQPPPERMTISANVAAQSERVHAISNMLSTPAKASTLTYDNGDGTPGLARAPHVATGANIALNLSARGGASGRGGAQQQQLQADSSGNWQSPCANGATRHSTSCTAAASHVSRSRMSSDSVAQQQLSRSRAQTDGAEGSQRRGLGVPRACSNHLYAASTRSSVGPALEGRISAVMNARLPAEFGELPDPWDAQANVPIFLSDVGYAALLCSPTLISTLAAMSVASGKLDGQTRAEVAEAEHEAAQAAAAAARSTKRASRTSRISRASWASLTSPSRKASTAERVSPARRIQASQLSVGSLEPLSEPPSSGTASPSKSGAPSPAKTDPPERVADAHPNGLRSKWTVATEELKLNTSMLDLNARLSPATRRRTWRMSTERLLHLAPHDEAPPPVQPSSSAQPLVIEASMVLDSLFAIFDRSGNGKIHVSDVRLLQGALGEMGSKEIGVLLSYLLDAATRLAPGRSSRAQSEGRSAAQADKSGGDADAVVIAGTEPTPKERTRALNKVSFFMGAASWILASQLAEEAPGADAESAADKPPDVNSDADGADPTAGSVAAQRAEIIAGLHAALSDAHACHALAESIDARRERRKLKRNALVDAAKLLSIVTQTAAIPSGVSGAELISWCSEHLRLIISVHAEGDGEHEPGTPKAGQDIPTLGLSEGNLRVRSEQSHEHEDKPKATWAMMRDAFAMRSVKLSADALDARASTRGSSTSLCGRALTLARAILVYLVSAQGGEASERDGSASKSSGGGGVPTSGPRWYSIDHRSPLAVRFHQLFLAVLCWDLVVIPVQLCFYAEVSELAWINDVNVFADTVYWTHLASRFLLSFVNEKSVVIYAPREIQINYLTTDFPLDAIAFWPQSQLAFALGSAHFDSLALRLLRLIAARYAWATYRTWEKSRADVKLSVGIVQHLLILVLISHLCCCVFNLFSYTTESAEPLPLTWASTYDAQLSALGQRDYSADAPEARLMRKWLLSYYFVVCSLTNLSTGQLPITYGETLWMILMMIMYFTVYSWAVSQISALVMKQDDEIVTKRGQLQLVKGYLAHIRVHRDLELEISNLFHARLKDASSSSMRPDSIQAAIPVSLQIEVSRFTRRGIVSACALFRGCSDGFIDRLASLVREKVCDPDQLLYRKTDICREMYIVQSGAVRTYDEAPDDPTEHLNTMTVIAGETVGEVSLVFGMKHFANARTELETLTKLVTLSDESFKLLIKMFPDQEDILMDNAMLRWEGAIAARLVRPVDRRPRPGRLRPSRAVLRARTRLPPALRSLPLALASTHAAHTVQAWG
jgi:ankyrin repeat protein